MESTDLSMNSHKDQTRRGSWFIKGFLFTNRLVRRFYTLVLALHQGFWLGILNKQSIVQLVDKSYDLFSGYRSNDYLHSGLFPWEKYSVETYFKECETILVGAAGGGREIIALHKMDYHTDAFDCNRQMIAVAEAALKTEQIDCRYEYAEPDQVPENFGIYDGLIMGWAGYSHIIGQADRIKFLKEFRQHIRMDGVVLISFFARKNNSTSFKVTYALGHLIRKIRFSRENLELGDTLIEFYLHYFNQSEVEHELSSAGFALVYYSDAGFGHAIARAL